MTASPADEIGLNQQPFDAMLDGPKFLLGDVAHAAGVTMAVLKAWLSPDRQIIVFGRYDRPPLGKGSARVFTLRRVLSIAIVAELVRLGVAPASATYLAYALTDSSLTDLAKLQQSAEPTILFAYPDGERFAISRGGYLQLREAFRNLPDKGSESQSASFLCVNYNEIFRRVKENLAARGKLDETG